MHLPITTVRTVSATRRTASSACVSGWNHRRQRRARGAARLSGRRAPVRAVFAHGRSGRPRPPQWPRNRHVGPASGQFSSALTNAAVTCSSPVGVILARVSGLGDCTLGSTGVLKVPMGQDRGEEVAIGPSSRPPCSPSPFLRRGHHDEEELGRLSRKPDAHSQDPPPG